MSSLDPAYIDWLKETTNRLWPIIRDGHFALHTYHTNFNLGKKDIGKADEKEKEIDVLCDKYGPLYSNIAFAKVDEDAWVTSYRQKYRYDGDDVELLGLMAQAFEETKSGLMKIDQKKTANTSTTAIVQNALRNVKTAKAHIENPYDRDSDDEDDGDEHDRYEQENDLDDTLRGGYGRRGHGWD